MVRIMRKKKKEHLVILLFYYDMDYNDPIFRDSSLLSSELKNTGGAEKYR